ncbi:hypothetical protein B484DRAFT_396270 [Ochromonadaceae sp. CCMP2298]|nr:hypothetical protein B484DRAFT_396270 [Ochromonadaceae sp. CCMP2298]
MTQRIYSPSKAAQEALPYLRKPRSSSGSSLSADSAGETGSVEVEAEAEAETEIEIETGTEAETEAEGEGLRVGILFGRERSGLTNEEVALADSIISIPTFKQFSSLNLAQAVNIVGYELWKRQTELMEAEAPAEWLHPRDGERLARVSELDNFLGRQEKCMDERGFQPEPQMRQYAFRNIRNIYQRVLVTKQEIDVLQGVLSCLVKPPRTQAQSTEGGLKDTKETNVDGNIAMGTVGNAPEQRDTETRTQ